METLQNFFRRYFLYGLPYISYTANTYTVVIPYTVFQKEMKSDNQN